MRLEDKVIIITGGAGGIGGGMAKAMAKEGAKIAIVDFNPEMGEKTLKEVQQFSKESIFIQGDLTKHDELPSIVQKTVDKFGRLDALVNNAHASKQMPFIETTKEDLALSFDTGFYPTWFLMQAAFPYLRESKGTVINFASGAGINGHATQSAYAAAKEAIRGLTRVAANEWGQFGITVNCIGPVANSEGVQQWAKAQPEYYEKVLNNIPMRKFGDVETDIGRAAVFLASEDAKYITGQTIMVDGGSTMLH